MKKLNILLMGILLTQLSQANFTDDSDFTTIQKADLLEIIDTATNILTPDKLEVLEKTGGTDVLVYRVDHGKPQLVEGLNFTVIQNKLDCTKTAKLYNPKYSVSLGSKNYEITINAPCDKSVAITFNDENIGNQALGIWVIANKAYKKLSETVGVKFWTMPIRFNFPADGDYYSFGSVSITDGRKWDVVGHELGHAIYDQARIGAFGGGSHKIDLCYSDALAISEGWASYFSAWLSLDPNDADAKFEYMVPRRAPIQVENVPADVCKGPRSEWRVFSFFWDLNDLHNDGENSDITFIATWNALLNKSAQDMTQMVKSLQYSGIQPELIKLVWALNFQTPLAF